MSAKFLTTSTTFNRFLYAGVDDDRNGIELPVLSALARQNMDPWQQAAQSGPVGPVGPIAAEQAPPAFQGR